MSTKKKERTLNVARAVRLHSTVVLIARENTGISIDSHVRLWPRSRPQRKLNLSYSTVKDLLYISVFYSVNKVLVTVFYKVFTVTFINTNSFTPYGGSPSYRRNIQTSKRTTGAPNCLFRGTVLYCALRWKHIQRRMTCMTDVHLF